MAFGVLQRYELRLMQEEVPYTELMNWLSMFFDAK